MRWFGRHDSRRPTQERSQMRKLPLIFSGLFFALPVAAAEAPAAPPTDKVELKEDLPAPKPEGPAPESSPTPPAQPPASNPAPSPVTPATPPAKAAANVPPPPTNVA